MTRAPARRSADPGFVTAETAVVLPALVLLLALVLALVRAAGLQAQALDAAGVAARTAARGEGDAAVVAAARRVLPVGGDVRVQRDHGLVTVRVRLSLAESSPLAAVLGGLAVTARAVSVDEAAP